MVIIEDVEEETGASMQIATYDEEKDLKEIRAENHRKIDARTLMQHFAVNGLDDAVGELLHQQIATRGCVQCGCDCGRLVCDSGVGFIQVWRAIQKKNRR